MTTLRAAAARRLLPALAATAVATAGLVGAVASPAAAQPASRPASAVLFALQQLGRPYVYGGTGATGYDCSGLVQTSYAHAGLALPRTAGQQYNAGTHVPLAQLLPGDLVFYGSNTADPATVYHVGMYLGGGHAVFAPHTGTVVQVENIWWTGLMPMATRPLHGGNPMLTVARGEADDATRAVQLRLNANGAHLAVDGGFGPLTAAAVASFQSAHGLLPNGIVGPRTFGALVANGTRTTPTVRAGAAAPVTSPAVGQRPVRPVADVLER